MTRQTKPTERWEIAQVDSRGNARQIVIYDEPETEHPPMVIDHGAPIVSPLPVMQPRITSHIEGSPEQRARAFGIETLQLSLVVGVLFVIGAWFLSGSTLGLLTLALTYGAGFCATWLIAYLAHILRSPEGVELYQTYRLWNFLDTAASRRWQRAGIEQPKRLTGDRVLLGIFLFTMLGVCAGVLVYRAAMEGLL